MSRMSKAFSTFIDSFRVLKGAPRELWIVYLLKLLESYAYFSMSYVLVIYLSREFGYTDIQAGWAYGIFGTLISVYGLFVGFVIDNLGVKLSLVLGSVLLLISRFVMATTSSEPVLLFMLYGLLPMGTALGIPVMMTGIRRYTNDETRTMAFSLFYVMMNIAALVAGPAVDMFRRFFEKGVDYDFAGMFDSAVHLDPYRLLLLSGAAVTLIMLAVAIFFVREIDVGKEGMAAEFKPKKAPPWQIIKEIAGSSRFWRFLLFIVLLIGVRFIFRHLDATFPKYMIREFGEDAPYGTIIGINPFIIIFLVPLVSAFTKEVSAFKMILYGSFVSAISVFALTIGPYYWAAITFVVLLSIGEAFWSPRLYEYTAMIAPKGREGTYMALASAPMFLAKLVVGGLSGWLLATFCPEHGPRNSELMWFIIGLMSISSPVLILVLRKVIEGGGSVEVLSDEAEEG